MNRLRPRLTLLVPLLVMSSLCFWPLRSASARAPECDTVEVMDKPASDDPVIDKEIFNVAGDADDPRAYDPAGSGTQGVSPGYSMTQTALGHPMCHYRFGDLDMLVELDVYKLHGQPMYVHLLCPHCQARGKTNALRITQDNKAMSYDPNGIARTFPGWTDRQMVNTFRSGTGGLVSIERFRCTWEVDDRYRVAIGAICDFEAVIENNVVRRETQGAVGQAFRRIGRFLRG